MKQTKIWLAVITIFMSGLMAGLVSGLALARYQVIRTIEQGPESLRPIIMRRLARELSLSEPQQQSIAPIVVRAQDQLQQLRRNQQPSIQRIVDQALFEIRPELNDDQLKKLDLLQQRLTRRWGLASER